MWVFSKHGFVSVVAHRDMPNMMLLRHRTKEHAEATAYIIGGDKRVFLDESADYRWRVLATRYELSLILDALAKDIDYDNFKDAVAILHGPKGPYVTLLHRIWSASVQALGIGKNYYTKLQHCIEANPNFEEDDDDPYPFTH